MSAFEEQEKHLPVEGAEEDYSLPLSARRETSPSDGGSASPPPPPQNTPLPDRGWSTAALKETLVAAGIATLLGLAICYLPGIGLLASLFLPWALAGLTLRRDWGWGMLAALLMFGVLFCFCKLDAASNIFLQYGLLGVAFGACFRREVRAVPTILLGTLVFLLGQLLYLAFSFYLSGTPLSELPHLFEETYAAMLQSMTDSGLLPGDSSGLPTMLDSALEMMKKLLPGSMALSALVTSFVSYLIAAGLLRRGGYAIPRLAKFNTWRMDWRFIWGLILGLLLSWLGRLLNQFWLESIGGSLMVVFWPIIILCGVGVLVWLLQNLEFSVLLKVVIVVLLILGGVITLFGLTLLAAYDGVRDLRTRIRQRKDRSSD